MDFLAQQFIANANRLRNRLRELSAKVDALEGTLSNLTDRLKDVKDAIDRHQEAETKSREIHPPTAVTELRTQVPISVQTYAQRSTKERVWGKIKGTLEVAVGIAVILYTGISYKTWQQTIDATNFTARQIKLSRQGLNETVKNFKIEERPYVAITQAIQQPLTIGTNAIDFTIENSGKTPALGMIVSPEIFVGAKRLKVTSLFKQKSESVLPANKGSASTYNFALTEQDVNSIRAGKQRLEFRIIIAYSDIFKDPHKTRLCGDFEVSKNAYYYCASGSEIE